MRAVVASLRMTRPSQSLARWLKLVLACVALAALSPAQAVAGGAVAESVALVQGGPAKALAARTSVRAARYSPPAVDHRVESDAVPEAARLGSPAVRERLFLLHRALLR